MHQSPFIKSFRKVIYLTIQTGELQTQFASTEEGQMMKKEDNFNRVHENWNRRLLLST